jgi:hypothetical protein
MTMDTIRDGITILLRYLNADDYHDIAFEHDQMWCDGPPPDKMEMNDVKRLSDLGWFWDDVERWSHF